MDEPPIPRTALAPDLEISRVVTGLWQVADMERGGKALEPEAAAAAMAPYVAAGLTTFDMADHYGSAEVIAGHYRQQHGGAGAEFLTKWVPPPGPVSRPQVRAAVERALRRLQAEQLELLQFHTWSYADPSWLDALLWLHELKEEGLIRRLGLTNFDTAHLRLVLASGIEVVSNQVCFSLLDRRPAGAMSELCRRHGVKLLAYGTLAGGLFSERWLGQPPPASETRTWSQAKYLRFIDVAGGWEAFQRLLRTLDEEARRLGVSIANVAARFVLEQPAVGAVIIGARLGRSEHLAETRRLVAFALDDEARRRIAEAAAQLLPIPGDSGDEYRKPPFLTASGDLSDHLESFPPPYASAPGPQGRTLVLTGSRWEELAGYCRAVRIGDRIVVSGTTATHRDRVVGGLDAAAQFHAAVDKLEGVLQTLGARLEDVIRTRVYVRELSDWEAVARAHGERFGAILPANTLVAAGIVGEEYRVELEAEAVVGEERSGRAQLS